jgi:hypothetical protein
MMLKKVLPITEMIVHNLKYLFQGIFGLANKLLKSSFVVKLSTRSKNDRIFQEKMPCVVVFAPLELIQLLLH